MPMPTLSFLLGLLLLGYLSTFVVFAVLRIATGVSIQRLGLSGFRHIAFTLRHGVKINVRGIGLSVHRPTFALPTWCSLVVTDLVVTVDLQALGENRAATLGLFEKTNGTASGAAGRPQSSDGEGKGIDGPGKLWKRLNRVKETIKRLHGKINWIRLVDLMVWGVKVHVVGVGSVQVERVLLSVDTRSKTVDRSRLFQHHKTKPDTQSPAEWKSLIRSILFTPEGRDSTEILDYVNLNIHGMLHSQLQGLRDASITVKLGRFNVPYDDIEHAKKCADLLRGRYAQPHGERAASENAAAELDDSEPASDKGDRVAKNVSDSRAFVASTLRGIQEVQFAIGFFGLSRRVDVKSEAGKDVYFNLAMKELGLDIVRLDPKSPAHRMYFSSKDVAHHGMLTAISISAGIDDGHEHPERMLHIPMITATVKTTLPSRTVHFSRHPDAMERNTNMLYANFVCTSPSVDLDPKHLPLIRDILKQRSAPHSPQSHYGANHHYLISQFLPKAYVKIAIQEPVLRVSLPPMDKTATAEDDYDLLISSGSTMALELESSHAAEGGINYSLGTKYRHTRHSVYYQTYNGVRHDLLQSESVELQVDVQGIPDASVVASGRLQTFTLFLVRPEICEGVRQIVKQLRKNVLTRHENSDTPRPSFLRSTPAWLEQCRIEGSDFGIELAGVDDPMSKESRGFALQLESWTTEYKAHREEQPDMFTRRSSIGRATQSKEKSAHSRERSPRRRLQSFADGRRLTVHLQTLEGYIVDSVEKSEPESFMSVPRFEVAFSTTTDSNGPVFHINSHARSVLLQYSLYNHFAMGVAVMVIRTTFLDGLGDTPKREPKTSHHPTMLTVPGSALSEKDEVARHEITIIDFKSNLVQVKARMPADPPMMVQIFGLETGRHRWGAPFLRSKVARMYVRAPRTKMAWSRIVSTKGLRLDLREIKRKHGKANVTEKSIDVIIESIRFSVPHSLIVHSIFDNITNVVKTTKQLQHHFKTGTNDYILTKEPEGPKHVPRITFRTKLFLFDVEDSGFEWKLNAIYRSGLLEQKQRLAREDAFKLKEKRLARLSQRNSSKLRAQSAHVDDRARSRHRDKDGQSEAKPRSASIHQPAGHSVNHSLDQGRRKMRYDVDGKCDLSDTSRLTTDAARDRLDRLNAQSWKSRIDRVLYFQSNAIREIRTAFLGMDDIPDEAEQQEPILAVNQRPGLLVVYFAELSITVDKPSFPLEEYQQFLNDVGKGMPSDMKYGLLVPMHLHITMGEARFQLRDYPLPLFHVPALANGQSPRLAALSMKTDFVVAEEFRDIESQREVNVQIIPPEKMNDRKGMDIVVRRTISSIKTYSDMKFEINTSNPTKITWGTSYQPAIQDTMQVIESFTKPPFDPSDRVGFWDKIRLSFHSRVDVAWKGDGDVHLVLKGSRDPYVLTGQGVGLVMVWRNDVRWNIAQSKDPREFMTVDSTEYILAVPDFNSYARRSQEGEDNGDGGSSTTSSASRKDAIFKKVVMKLSGNVRWVAGLMFERDLADGSRSFDFKPHYDVVLKHPDFAKAPPGKEYDAYRDFRSHHIHMSVAITAPHDRQWSLSNLSPSNNYNAIHLTPRFFSHFFSWWSMFSGVMSLPIRQGPLWGAMQKKSKKFGRHVATFKYNLLLSPLYVSHVYKHKDAEDYQENVVSATGLKMRLDSFMLDMHQRREYFDIPGHKGGLTKKSSGLRIHQALLDFIHADLRALSASITGTSIGDIDKASDETLASLYGQVPLVDMQKFEIPDHDFDWVDMDDFVELDWILPAESDPETKILPLGFAPRFTYFRQTDHAGKIAGDPTRSSPFGQEPTHHCVMSVRNDPRRVQLELIRKRLAILQDHQVTHQRAVGEQELKIVQNSASDKATRDKLQHSLEMLQRHSQHLTEKFEFLETMEKTLADRLEKDDPAAVPDLETTQEFFEAREDAHKSNDEILRVDTAPLADYSSDFNNRFIVHNAQIKWNNSLRNIILRYIHQNSQRRGFVYYMSQRAVKFILDVIEEQKKKEEAHDAAAKKAPSVSQSSTTQDVDDEQTIQDRIDELLRDGKSFVNADDTPDTKTDDVSVEDARKDDIAVEYTPLNTYQFRLIAPQIQLQSEKNAKAAVLVTAKGMQLKVVQIMDRDRVSDDVSGLVQRRFTAAADSLQMFVTTTKTFTTEHLHMYSANTYGSKKGSYWPPWVPMEIMFEFETNPYGFERVVDQTSASLRYDKYNTLRLKYNDDVTGGESNSAKSSAESETRMDHIWLEFPSFRAICDSGQYFALYIIVMDLLLYNEPLEKTRSERLEKIMLASDFSDLSGAPEMVHMLQERIRQLEEIKTHFQVNEKFLDRQGWKDRISMDRDLISCEDELFFMMKAITTSQQRVEDRRDHDEVTGLMRLNLSSKEIVWHLTREKGESLMEFQLKHASFDRTVYNDGSNYNCMEIGRINGLNLLPDALYPEIIAPFIDESRGIFDHRHGRMLRVHWLMLEAIAGIPVVDYFEIDLVPLKLQIEREVAKRVFEYIFPGAGGNAFDGGGFSPFMVKHMLPTQEEEDELEASAADGGPSMPESLELDSTSSESRGLASLESRLKPTLHLQKRQKTKSESRGLGISNPGTSSHGFGHIMHRDHTKSRPYSSQSRTSASRHSLTPTSNNTLGPSRSPSERSLVNLRNEKTNGEGEKRRFALKRTHSNETTSEKDDKDKSKENSDDLTQMMSRASNYMTLAFVKIPSVVLCLSYKGQGRRNLEDVHDLVFRMPMLEYRNKTWSNLDLALQLKKDIIKALISHAGAIVGNKFSQHKPSRQQQVRLREIANLSTSMSPVASGAGLASSSRPVSLAGTHTTIPDGRPSTASAGLSSLERSISINSTPSASSTTDLRLEPDANGKNSGHTNGLLTPQRRMSNSQTTTPESSDPLRNRAASLSRHLSGFGERLRQRQTENSANGSVNGNDVEVEENKRKSKLLLGGQKLLRTLRDS